MACTRVFSVLDLELSQSLSFEFSIDEHLTRPGSTSIRPGDRFRLVVWACNQSGLPLRTVCGSIAPTTMAVFPSTRFRVSRLRPGHSRRVAVIEVAIPRGTVGSCLHFDRIGVVSCTIRPDLSRYSLEKSRPLVFSHTA